LAITLYETPTDPVVGYEIHPELIVITSGDLKCHGYILVDGAWKIWEHRWGKEARLLDRNSFPGEWVLK
jgi:hypothetical protein